MKEPRYDEVYFQGVASLDAEDVHPVGQAMSAPGKEAWEIAGALYRNGSYVQMDVVYALQELIDERDHNWKAYQSARADLNAERELRAQMAEEKLALHKRADAAEAKLAALVADLRSWNSIPGDRTIIWPDLEAILNKHEGKP